MDKLFLDANVLFAASYSKAGGPRAIFELAKRKKIVIVSSKYAIREAQFNIQNKLDLPYLLEFYKLISLLFFVDRKVVIAEENKKYQNLINLKDLPILVSAIKQKSGFLITLDKKDFKTSKLRGMKLPFLIMSPGEYLQNL